MTDEPIVIRTEDLPPDGWAPHAAIENGLEPLARASMVLGIASIPLVGLAVGPTAIICGLVARRRIRRGRGRGHRQAQVGIWTGLAGILVWTGLLIYILQAHPGHSRQETAVPTAVPRGGVIDLASIKGASEQVRHALGSHVSLTVLDSTLRAVAAGSGVLLGAENGRTYVLTCRHLFESVAIVGANVKGSNIHGDGANGAVVWASQGAMDLAIIEFPQVVFDAFASPIHLAWSGSLSVGDDVLAVGDPINYDASVIRGVASAVRMVESNGTTVRIIQAQIPLNHGNSGGGLYDDRGRLVGINSWTLPKETAEGMGFSIAIENIWSVLTGMPSPVVALLESLRAAAEADSVSTGGKART